VVWKDGETTLPTVPAPSCVKRECPTLSDPDSGSYDKKTGVFEDQVTLTCTGGRVPTPLGADKVTCGKDGAWAPVASCQEVACQAITVANGKVKDKNGATPTTYPIGAEFTFACDTGFKLSVADSYSITCEKNGNQPTGSYSDALPTCSNIDDCKDVDCLNGKCVDGIGEFTCSCNAGFEVGDDKKCSKETDPCAGTPCKNNAVCTTNADFTANPNQFEYKCACPEGGTYSGYDCQKDSSLNWSDAATYCENGVAATVKQPHPGSCKKYIQCRFGTQVSQLDCGNNKVFDSQKKECTTPANASKESKCTRNY